MHNQINDIVEETIEKMKENIYKFFVKIGKLIIIFILSFFIHTFIIHPYTGVTKDTDMFTRLLIDIIAMFWAINTFKPILRDFPQLREKLVWLIN